MSDYSQITYFTPKDSLSTGNPNKIIYGSDMDAELSAISTAIATKADVDGDAIGAGTPATELSVDNLKLDANKIVSTNTDGDIELEPNGTGTVVITNVDVAAGEIDGTAIGANSASTGAFTTLTASGDVNFDGGTFFVDASADAVGIGTTSPADLLHVKGSTAAVGDYQIVTEGTVGGYGAGVSFQSQLTGGSLAEMARITADGEAAWDTTAANQDAGLRFYTSLDGTVAEKMRIDSFGNFGLNQNGTSTIKGVFMLQEGYTSASRIGICHENGVASGNNYVEFYYNSGLIGSISQSGTTAVAYNTSSDARLKENIADAEDASSLVDAIKVRQFDWKADGSHQRYGMVAQELLEVAPEAVHQPQDPDEMMGVDYAKLVPMLVKEIQSLRARVHALEGK